MYYILNKYKGKDINIFTKSGGQYTGTLIEIIVSTNSEFIAVISDRWSSKRYLDVSDISNFWCHDDKPTED